MTQHWNIHAETGFLLQPHLHQYSGDGNSGLSAASIAAIEIAAAHLPDWLSNGKCALLLRTLAQVDFGTFQPSGADTRLCERLFRVYGYFASAWVHGFGQTVIPRPIAEPLTVIAGQLQRPPILSYTGQVLTNWRLKDPDAAFTPHNIELLQQFTHLVDESWFFRVHIAIEAQAAAMLTALSTVDEPIAAADDMAVLHCIRALQSGLIDITRTFHKMPDLCDPDVYYQQIRPYLMSFDTEVVFEGVQPNPTPLRGGSGAQSSIVPALLAALGIEHQSTQLTASLTDMQRYMPVEHRAFIQRMSKLSLRDYCKSRPHLADAYNHILRRLITFRRAHLYFARTYIFEKSTNPTGTGGTVYMTFLSQLIDETADYLL